ncbi:hypothetical protein FRB98_001751 [Tulasnella sp. 332]|nr:hypothetical protein FRB98_001751 [Tulasnella sp. 332]
MRHPDLAALLYAAYPGYIGGRPKIAVWQDIEADGVGHPILVDDTVDSVWFGIITPTATITNPIWAPTPTPTSSVSEYAQYGR